MGKLWGLGNLGKLGNLGNLGKLGNLGCLSASVRRRAPALAARRDEREGAKNHQMRSVKIFRSAAFFLTNSFRISISEI